MSDLVERLREEALEADKEAWRRMDGGHEYSMGAMLADEAADRIEALEAANARLREALLGLEHACQQLAATRPHEVYLAMVDGGQSDALLSLDARRIAARAALAEPQP